MNILLVGSGAREHALAKALKRSQSTLHLFCAGSSSNPGIEALCYEYWFGDISKVQEIRALALQWKINLAIIGPEAPLEKGLADLLWDCGIPVVGPKKQLAQIETSKSFARELMRQYDIPGVPKYKVFENLEGIASFLEALGSGNYVIKANGLMAGKGVKVAGDHLHSFEEAMAYCQEIIASNQRLVIEEKLIGQEFSLMCFSDGFTLAPMPIVQDNKRAYDKDKGPNTGGMGSYSMPNHSLPFLTEAEVERALHINQLVIKALMKAVDDKYIGILYGGFIATARGIYVIEFNARFGDPESLNVLSILDTDFYNLCMSMVEGRLKDTDVTFSPLATVCKYAVPLGYPDNPKKDFEIDIQGVIDKSNLYLASVHEEDGKLKAMGSRTAAYVGLANSLSEAEYVAEQEISRIKGPLYHRKDIGKADLINKAINQMQKVRSL